MDDVGYRFLTYNTELLKELWVEIEKSSKYEFNLKKSDHVYVREAHYAFFILDELKLVL